MILAVFDAIDAGKYELEGISVRYVHFHHLLEIRIRTLLLFLAADQLQG
jgi:hypothetical protein